VNGLTRRIYVELGWKQGGTVTQDVEICGFLTILITDGEVDSEGRIMSSEIVAGLVRRTAVRLETNPMAD
jgi:hypothetical protein